MLSTEHITVMSQAEAEKYIERFDIPHVVISIVDPDGDPAGGAKADVGVIGQHGCYSILRLWFHDTDKPDDPIWMPPTADQARLVVEFIEQYKDLITTGKCHVFVHCLAGISRSSATAAAISRRLFKQDDVYFKILWPNLLVYDLILKEWEQYDKQTQGTLS